MSLNSIYSVCPAIQTGLVDAFGVGQAPEMLPFLEFVNSPVNTRAITQLVSPGGAKKRTVKLSFFPRLPETQVIEQGACGPFDEIGDNTKEYEITNPAITSGETIRPESIAEYCTNNATLLNQKLALHMDVVDRAVATQSATEVAALIGNFSTSAEAYYTTGNPDGVINANVLELATRFTSGEQTGWLQSLKQALSMTNYSGSEVAFGGPAFNSAFQRAMAGCCTNSGLNIQEVLRMFGTAFAYDKRIAAALGSPNKAIVTQPGAVQLLSYQLAGWKDGFPPEAIMGSNYVRLGAFTRAGVPVDILFKDDCPGELSISVTAQTQIITLPDNMFYVGDDFYGVNYLNEIEVKNA
jgi:hypothetical protein